MIVPEYWAEASIVVANGERRTTLRRFGWSNDSQIAAQFHADERLKQAVSDWHSDQKILRRERKIAYNGSEGVPIREEVIEANEYYAITRNAYGALCLNTQNVLIADVDRSESSDDVGCLIAVILGIVALFFGFGGILWIALLFAALAITTLLIAKVHNSSHSNSSREKQIQCFENYSKENPSWGLRIYETPLGFRLIASHRTFDPQSAEVTEFFRTIGVDKVYARMCLRQNCFRARLTAKPWRCGINDHMLPRAVWPIKEELLPIRQAWVERYNAAAVNYAACRFIRSLGPDSLNLDVDAVISIHDKLCQANSSLPLA